MTDKNFDTKKFPPALANVPHMLHGGDYNPDQWLHVPGIIDEDMRLMKLAGMNSASLGIFAWQKIEPMEGVFTFEWLDEVMDKLHNAGINVILATPSGARPAWLDAKYKEVLRVNGDRTKNLHGARHNHCYTSPYFRQKVYDVNHRLAERYKNHPALSMWHISNEYGGECHCELCQNAFRDWLKVRYDNDINKVNQAWWTAFWGHGLTSFEQIESPSSLGDSNLHGLTLDWKRFVSYQTTEFLKNEVAAVKSVTPNIPAVANFMGTYEGLDPHVMAKAIDVVTWDNYPEWHTTVVSEERNASDNGFLHDINRSLKDGKPFLLMECTPSLVNWRPVNNLKHPHMHKLSAIQAIAHGSDSIMYFQWRKSRGASEKFHGAVIDHCGHENTRVFKEVAEVSSMLNKLDSIVGTTVKPQVAVVYDWENRWGIDNLQGLSAQRNYEALCKSHYNMMWKRGISCDIINAEHDFDCYKLVVAPMLYMLKPNVAKRLADFVLNGGQVVFTFCTGYVDEHDLCKLGGFPGDGLDKVAGIWAEEIDSLYPDEHNSVIFGDNAEFESKAFCEIIHPINNDVEVLATYGSNFYKDSPAITRNRFGKGECTYIATQVNDSCLDKLYEEIVQRADIVPAIGEKIDLPSGVTIQQRYGNGENYLFVMNFNNSATTVTLPKDKSYLNLENGETIADKIILDNYSAVILNELQPKN